MKERNFNAILNNTKKLAKKVGMDAYIDLIAKVNKKKYMEEKYMYKDTIAMIAEETGLKDEWVGQYREQGRVDEKLQIARNLLSKGSSPEFVQEITGLSLDQIEKL